MSYSNNMTKIEGKVTSMEGFVTNVKKMNMDSIWKGGAATAYIGHIDSIITRINKEKENIETFNRALEKVERLKEFDAKIKKEKSSLYGLDPKKDFDKINSINSAIRWYTKEREKLKSSIISLLGTISSDAGSGNSFLFNNTANFDYIFDIKELEDIVWKSYRYGTSNGGSFGNIADLYSDVQANGLSGMDYVNSQLDSVLKSYKGREAAVNSSLMLMKLASDKGKRIRYMNSGSNGHNGVKYNTNEQMIDGMDCCAYVSWAVNKGTPQPFHWEGVGAFGMIGDPIDVSQSQPGDVVVNNKHVAMIIANNTETGQVTIAESGGLSSDYHIKTYDYDKIRGSFPSGTSPKVMSLEDYYNGTKSNINGSATVNFPTWKEKEDFL